MKQEWCEVRVVTYSLVDHCVTAPVSSVMSSAFVDRGRLRHWEGGKGGWGSQQNKSTVGQGRLVDAQT